MFILLPPSETKAPGGDGPALDVSTLSFPSLNDVRVQNIADLVRLDIDTALDVLGISAGLVAEAEANARLVDAPTMPAIFRYTGVLYDALDAATLTSAARGRLGVGSALFGVLRADDMVPHYRLSAGTKLPDSRGDTPTMKARWGSRVTDALKETQQDGETGTVVDLRSGGYQQLGRLPGAVTVRVESVQQDGSRKVVSHFNKHYKGVLARVLAQSEVDVPTVDGVGDVAGIASVARDAGLTVEINERVSAGGSGGRTKPPKDSLTLVV